MNDIFKNRRSIRKFKRRDIDKNILNYIADAARLAPYPANLQPVKLCIVREKADEVFGCIKWAGYLPDWAPEKSEAPATYIAILGDRDIKKNEEFELEAGIAGTAISFAAEKCGVSSCWLGAIDRAKISGILDLPDNLKLMYVIALGYADQESEAYDSNETVRYSMDSNGKIHVPKRDFNSVVFYK